MKNVDTWAELFHSEDLNRVNMVATCLAAMEFDVRLGCAGHRQPKCGGAKGCHPPYVIQVPADDFPHLVELLDEIIDEQEQFDHFIDSWHTRARNGERRLLIALIIIVGGLAAVGAVDL